MTFLLRALTIVIGVAFALSAVNLYLNWDATTAAPGTENAPVEVTLATPDAAAAAPQGAPSAADVANIALTALLGRPDGTETPQTRPPAGTEPSAQTAPAFAPFSGPSTDAAAIEQVWRDWMAANGVTTGSMVLRLPDGATHRAGLDRDPAQVVPVASLSKAITGICLNEVLNEQGLSWYTRLRDIAPQMSAVRVTPQPWNEHLTLASLVTHSSGVAPDLTQGTMGSDLHGALGLHRRIASEALREENMTGAEREFFYNNTNYAVLGVVIEALTGQSYSEACMQRVVAPAGISDAVIHGRMGSRSSYGGWEFSADSYAQLAQHWFSAGQPHIDNPAEHPMFEYYGLGYILHGAGRGAQAHHFGRFCNSDGSGTGAIFHASGDGTVFVANWDNCVSEGAYDLLSQAIDDVMN